MWTTRLAGRLTESSGAGRRETVAFEATTQPHGSGNLSRTDRSSVSHSLWDEKKDRGMHRTVACRAW